MRVSYVWRVLEGDRALASAFAKSLGIPRAVANLLLQRGIRDDAQARVYLDSASYSFCDPLLLTDMAAAVERIQRAIKLDEHVMIFGDYDVDGICATAILVRALRRMGLRNCSYGMPNRLKEGYGLSEERVQAAKNSGVGLLITVDNGISALGPALAARQCGIDLIVTDHHELGPELPQCCAVVNPKREPESHPAYYASGAAIAAKLAHALTGDSIDLDLAALGLIADIVPLRGENRAIVAKGVGCMAMAPKVGLRALMRVAKIAPEELTSEAVAFQLGPRINAGGRLGDGLAGLELLLTESFDEARAIAESLDASNTERRSIEKTITEEAIAEVDRTNAHRNNAIVLASSAWHPGVIGIVAARVMHTYYRPSILIAIEDNGLARGSGRSIPEIDLVACLTDCQEMLVKFGGHKAAAGITIEPARIAEFAGALDDAVCARIGANPLQPTLSIDAQVGLGEIDAAFVTSLERMQPFGHGNAAPIFCTYGARIAPNSVRELKGGHLRLALQGENKMHPAIAFGMAGTLGSLQSVSHADVAFTPRFNTWQGESTIQLLVKDIRPCT
jgi:single-stranded-DNA-specific exonuclease